MIVERMLARKPDEVLPRLVGVQADRAHVVI